MFQEFNKVTTTSNFIKNLLLSTYLPLIRTVRDQDYIIEGRLYVYKCNVIKCTKSGYIITGIQNITDSKSRATFEIKSEYFFGEKNDKLCTNFMSSTAGYDYLTHERLGKYLRSLRDMYNLNLMPLYNCFSNQPLGGHHIYDDRIVKTDLNFNTKVYKIPIRFNTDYTICIENLGMTTFAPAFVKNNNLIKADNTRFGNNTDLTNQYIKLHRGDVIINKPNLRFKHPIKIRFDNIPQTKTVRYNMEELKPFDVKHTDAWYRQVVGKREDHRYTRTVDENGTPTYHYYEYVPTLSPSNTLYPDNTLYPTMGDDTVLYESLNPSKGTFDSDTERFTTVVLRTHCNSLIPFDPYATYYVKNWFIFEKVENLTEEEYEADPEKYYLPSDFGGEPTKYYKLIPSTFLVPGDRLYPDDELYPFDQGDNTEAPNVQYTVPGKFVQCSEGEVFNMNRLYAIKEEENITWREKKYTYNRVTITEAQFNADKTSYWIKDGDNYVQCTESSTFDGRRAYYTRTWELVDTTDTWIDLDKEYYPRYKIQTEYSYTYDITEENCALYDAMENGLYLLIQVPEVFDQNILVLEGDYTHTTTEKIYDSSRVENFTAPFADLLYTSNLKLMEVSTTQIIPFSNTLMEFLTWNAINPLDTINNDMDRVATSLGKAIDEVYSEKYENYWAPVYRKRVYELGRKYNNCYITDNLGYITKDLEKIMYTRAADYVNIAGVDTGLDYESEVDR